MDRNKISETVVARVKKKANLLECKRKKSPIILKESGYDQLVATNESSY